VDALSNKEERRLHVLHHATGDIERVGDQAVNIAQRVLILLRDNHILSESARRDMNDLFEKTTSLYNRAVESLQEENRELARQALELGENVDRLERE
jgi:phosphate:Na+ symporter